jgi:hypothetical protein
VHSPQGDRSVHPSVIIADKQHPKFIESLTPIKKKAHIFNCGGVFLSLGAGPELQQNHPAEGRKYAA